MDSSTPAAEQLSLFDAVVATYAERERASNESLYQEVAARACAVGIIDSRTGATHVPQNGRRLIYLEESR